MKYGRVWLRLAAIGFSIQTGHPISSTGYLLGKLVRLGFFLLFLSAIYKHTRALAGYTLPEAMLFFLTFNVIDIAAQMLFRGIYGIRGLIREGDFDYFLIQPIHVLFRLSFNTVDFLDVVTLVPVAVIMSRILRDMPGGFDSGRLWIYLFLCANGLIIALAIHIAVAALAVLTQELENTIWIYRDLMTLGRFPVDIYGSFMKGVLIFVVPIAVMISFPAQAFMGKLDPIWTLWAVGLAGLSLTVSLLFWRLALSRYTSVSS